MDDLARLTNLFDAKQDASDPPIAVATVVNTRGSAYRRPGARMLVRRSLAVSGAVSAGCLERDIIAHCEDLVSGAKPFLLTYDGSSPDELVFGLKLGCDGIVQILIEPVIANTAKAKKSKPAKYRGLGQELHPLLAKHGRVAAVTIFDCIAGGASSSLKGTINTGLVMLETGTDSHFLEELPAQVFEVLRREARAALLEEDGRSLVVQETIGDFVISALIEIVEPLTSILVFGSGQDVAPLMQMAGVLGWEATVIGVKELDKLNQLQLVELVSEQAAKAVIVMTHDYERDRKILQALFSGLHAHGNFKYIGVVGPRRRSEKLVAELALAGINMGEGELSRLYSPVGLDIGAERPEEIALSILSEIKAVLAGHNGGMLREKQGPIHEPVKARAQLAGGRLIVGESLPVACRLDNV